MKSPGDIKHGRVELVAVPQQVATDAEQRRASSAKDVFWQTEGVTLYCGDALQILPILPAASVDAVITSPPYAEQRKDLYASIEPRRYPVWTANWFMAAEPSLRQNASILVNIREHIRDGEISDYVHKTRMLLRDIGFVECEEMLWIKPDAMPVGSCHRPRRSWERILWFGLSGKAYCNPKANGVSSQRIGLRAKDVGTSSDNWIKGYSKKFRNGTSRHRDYVECGINSNERGVDHPACYPVELAAWMVRGWSAPNATVVDPFMGSGSSGVAAIQNGRKFIGIELSEKYCAIARERIERAHAHTASGQSRLT